MQFAEDCLRLQITPKSCDTAAFLLLFCENILGEDASFCRSPPMDERTLFDSNIYYFPQLRCRNAFKRRQLLAVTARFQALIAYSDDGPRC